MYIVLKVLRIYRYRIFALTSPANKIFLEKKNRELSAKILHILIIILIFIIP